MPANTEPRRKPNVLVQWVDVFFIMALCFITLLSTMLMRGKVLIGNGTGEQHLDYSFSPFIFAAVVVLFVLYVWYMRSHSERELKDMINHVYGATEANGETSPPPPVETAEREGSAP
jgi:hypothetical protein